MRIKLNTEQHTRLLGGHPVMLWNTDTSDLVEPRSYVVIDEYRCFVNSAQLLTHQNPPVQRVIACISGVNHMLESTDAERVAYARAMIRELEMSEAIRLRQRLVNPWIKVERLYERIQTGLLCTRDEARILLSPLWHSGFLEVNKTNRYVRVVGGRL